MLPVVGADRLARAGPLHARRSDDHLGRPELGRDALDERSDRRAIEDVELDVQLALPAHHEVAARDGEAVVRKAPRDRRPEITTGTRDDRHPLAHLTSRWPPATLTDGSSPG